MSDWIKTTASDQFYQRIGNAAMASGSCAQATLFKVGYGWVDEGVSPPLLTTLTGAETDIPGAFLTGTKVDGEMTVSYSGGVLLIQCTVEAGSVSAATKMSTIGIYDQDGGLMAAAVFYPDWLTPDEECVLSVYINFPTSGA